MIFGEPIEMPERIRGTLESFNTEKGVAHGYVRLGTGELLHVPAINRGILQQDGSIRACMNGERYNAIPPGTAVFLDVTYNNEGKNPFAVSWAAKPQ